MIKIINFNYKVPENSIVVNTTSRSYNWSRGLSPFLLGPVDLYDGYKSVNVENAWQYSKVYEYYTDNGEPDESYFKWAQEGWNKIKADRYPMGRGVRPLYSYWAGEKLDYISARKKIYIPIYSNSVRDTDAFKNLNSKYQKMNKEDILYLQDFDAHSLEPGTFDYWDLWNNDQIKVGHGYVIAMMLEGLL